MEACSGGHHWARLFMAHGDTVRLIAPKFVAPYRMSEVRGKYGAANAAAIVREDERARQLMRLSGVDPTTATAVLAAAKNKVDGLSRWALALEERRGYWKAVVAIAAKNARMAWAMLARGESFKMPA